MTVLREALIRASESAWLRRQLTARALPRAIALRFVAGETVNDGLAVTRALVRAGKTVTLDYLGESVTDADEARAASRCVLEALDRVAQEGVPAGVSVKPTQMGLRISHALCVELLDEICTAAGRLGEHVTLDMEGSDVTEATVRLVERLRGAGHDVGCAVQAYLHRTRADVERLTAAGASLRLCKGAYAEPPAIAYQERTEVDRSYASLAEYLLAEGVYARLATHDDALIARAQNVAARLGLARDAFEFQMLYGVRPALQDALVRDGWRLRVYVPFGDQWYPYFMRRLAERPANLAFFLRALRGG
jgi:proline dehydrogenase